MTTFLRWLDASVHFNLRTTLWSITDQRRGHKRLVIDHLRETVLYDAVFKVSEAQRQTVLQKHCRSVHARVHGRWAQSDTASIVGLRRVTYNPYRFGYFHLLDGTPVYTAPRVVFGADGHAYID